MDYFQKLHTDLSDIFVSPTRNRDSDLYYFLEQAKPKFSTFFDVPPRNPAERAEIESGKVGIRGKSLLFNDDFKHETLFLAQELDISERFCAHLLDHVMIREPNLGRSATAEKAVLVFHEERRAKLACLRLILEKAFPEEGDSVRPGTSEMLQKYALDLLDANYQMGKDSKTKGRLAVKTLLEIDNIKSTISKQVSALQSALGTADPYAAQLQPRPVATGPKFGPHMIRTRIAALRHERRQLGHILFIIAIARELGINEINKVVRWLSTAEGNEEGLTLYVFTAALAAVDPTPDLDVDMGVDLLTGGSDAPKTFFRDPQHKVLMNSVVNLTAWKEPQLQAAMKLQWSLFLLEDRRRDPHLQGENLVVADEVASLVRDAIRGDAFKMLSTLVFLSRQREESDDLESANVADLFAGSSSNWRNTENENLVEPDFRPYLLQQFDITILNFISTMSPILREIKRHEEDASFAATRMTQRNLSNPPMRKSLATEPPKAPRNDVESFFRLIAYVYQEKEPDAALQFWVDDGTGKLFSFLKWAADSRQPGMVMAMYDMLAALARGPNCSAYAYNFLSSGGGQYAVGTGGNNQVYAAGPCSWSTLFGALEHYSTHLPNRQSTHASTSSSLRMSSTAVPAAQTATGAAASINFALPPEEVNLLRSFLLVLRTVVFFSPTARAALYENPTYRAMSSMFNLVVSLIPIELKSSIFETIAAFCSPGAGALGSDIIRQTWTILERFEILPVKKGAVAFGRGVLAELEQVEAVGKQYPGTTALIHLLNALVRVSGKKSGGSDAELSTIPENLGAGYRTAGVGPYVRFVIDEVFLKTAHRDFKFEAERWKVREACLCFMENCLAGFDLSALYREDFSNLNSRNASKAISTLAGVVTHPGSQVLLRILRDEAVRALIINFAAEGCQAISQGLIKTHYAKLCILRSLRIIHRVLEVEGVYIEGLVPLLHQVDTIPNVATDDIPPLSIPFLELSLLQSQQCVPNIARFVSLDGEDEMALLAIQILDELSQSRYFNTPSHGFNTASALRVDSLVVCLKDSEYLDHILDGFVQYLEPDPDDDPSLDDDPEVNSDTDTPSHLSHSIRSAILRLLLRNTQIGHRAPNIAHLLLGFAARGADVEVSVEDPKAANSRTSCLHAILDMLNVGVPRLDRKVRKGVPSQTPLSTKNPELAEKCYRLIFQLCSHTFTSSSTMRYLRTREDFFVRHLASLPMKAPSSPQVADGEVTYADTSSSRTTCRKFTAFVRLRAWVLDSVALELHVLTESAQHQKSAKLLELLFSSSSSVSEDPEDSLLGAAPGQSLIRVLEIFDTLSVQWTDYAAPADMNLQFYASIDWNASLREDENGCPIYDSSVLLSLMTSTRRQYQQQGALGADGVQRLLKAETKYVLESAVVENHRREIEYAKLMAYEAWRRVLDISLAKAFDRLPQEQREGILFDTLQAIPPVLAASVTSSPTAILLSEVILSLITKLREDHHNQLVLQTSPQDSFAASVPTDRLHVLFKSILDCLLNSVNTERARGNLYAALTNYLQLVLSTGDRGLSQFSENPNTPSDDMSLADEAFAPSTSRARPSTEQSALKLGTLQIVNQIAERLVVIVCGDAIDGSEVWKTVAFTLLDSLVRLSRADKAHRVLSVLVKHGFLQNFVQSVKESGFELQRVLKPDPPSLNALYVYEAKMSFLVRIAQTRQGADKLLNCRIFPLLSQCEFLASRPEKDQDFEDFDSFLPSAIERYHQIVAPALQLAVSVLSTIGPSATPVTKLALDFVYSQRETFSALLSDNMPQVSLSALKELHLLVALSAFVLPQVKDEPLFDVTGFKPIHSALLSLAARCVNRQRWNVGVVVSTEVEQEEAQQPVVGYGRKGTIWADKVNGVAKLLQKWLLIYLFNVTDSRTDGFKPVLGSSSSQTMDGGYSSHIEAKSPTVMDAIAALRSSLQEFGNGVGLLDDITSKIENFDDIGVEEAAEIASMCGLDFPDELEVAQRRTAIFMELVKALEREKREFLVTLHSIEILLCLIYRHLDFYLNSGPNARYSTTTERAMRMISTAKSNASGVRAGEAEEEMLMLRERAAGEVLPLLESLEATALPVEILGNEVSSRQAFIKLFGRRMREILADGRLRLNDMY